MKRNELFKSLMNVQSQVTSLMNVVLQESENAPAPEAGVEGEAKVMMEKNAAAEPSKDTAVQAAAKDKKFSEKIVDLLNRLNTADVQSKDFLEFCKWAGGISMAVGCVLAYILYPNMKQSFISAFNSGNPSLERVLALAKGVAGSAVVLLFIGAGALLLYHGMRKAGEGIDPQKQKVLYNALVLINNAKNKVIAALLTAIDPALRASLKETAKNFGNAIEAKYKETVNLAPKAAYVW